MKSQSEIESAVRHGLDALQQPITHPDNFYGLIAIRSIAYRLGLEGLHAEVEAMTKANLVANRVS